MMICNFRIIIRGTGGRLPFSQQDLILRTSLFARPASPDASGSTPGRSPAASPRPQSGFGRPCRPRRRAGTVRRRVHERQRPERPTGVEPGSVRDRSAGGRVLRRLFVHRRPDRRGSGRRRLGRDCADADVAQADLPVPCGGAVVVLLEPHDSRGGGLAPGGAVFAQKPWPLSLGCSLSHWRQPIEGLRLLGSGTAGKAGYSPERGKEFNQTRKTRGHLRGLALGTGGPSQNRLGAFRKHPGTLGRI